MPATNANHLQKARRNAPSRSKNPPITQPEKYTPILITSAVAAGSVLTLTFNCVVTLDRGAVPQITTDIVAATPVSAAQVAPNSVTITYSSAIAAATELTIEPRDPAIRNSSGGFVTSNTFPV
jgi:hypothetical protein